MERTASSLRTKIAIALMIVPLLLAIAIRYWPGRTGHGLPEISNVLLVRTELRGPGADAYVAPLMAAIRKSCDGVGNVRILPANDGPLPAIADDLAAAAGEHHADALLVSAITTDAGLLEIDLQLLQPNDRRTLWKDAYQSAQAQSTDLIQYAAQGVRRALRP